MTHHALYCVGRPQPPDTERVSALLARYPEVSRDEAREILGFLQTGRYRDVGMLTSDRRLDEKLDAFLKDHWIYFHMKSGDGTALAGGTFVLLFLMWIVWASFS